MKQICGMCVYYRGYCTNKHKLCVDGSEFRDERETISAQVAIDDIDKSVHIIINGDMIHDTEKFGKNLFDGVQKFIYDYMTTLQGGDPE